MKFDTEPGKKGPRDKILVLVCPKCGRRERLLLVDLAKWTRFKAKVERSAYGNGQKEEFLRKFLTACTSLDMNGNFIYSLRECCQLYGLVEYDNYDFSDVDF